jgi:hypothetical protein
MTYSISTSRGISIKYFQITGLEVDENRNALAATVELVGTDARLISGHQACQVRSEALVKQRNADPVGRGV